MLQELIDKIVSVVNQETVEHFGHRDHGQKNEMLF